MARFERLAPSTGWVTVFGNDDLVSWLRDAGLTADRAGTARAYVWLDGNRVIGYFAIPIVRLALIREMTGSTGELVRISPARDGHQVRASSQDRRVLANNAPLRIGPGTARAAAPRRWYATASSRQHYPGITSA